MTPEQLGLFDGNDADLMAQYLAHYPALQPSRNSAVQLSPRDEEELPAEINSKRGSSNSISVPPKVPPNDPPTATLARDKVSPRVSHRRPSTGPTKRIDVRLAKNSPVSDSSAFNSDDDTSATPSIWSIWYEYEEQKTKGPAASAFNAKKGKKGTARRQILDSFVVEELSNFTNSEIEQPPSVIRSCAVDPQGSEDHEHVELRTTKVGGRIISETLDSDSNEEDLGFSDIRDLGSSARRLRRRIGGRTISETIGSDSDEEDMGFSDIKDLGSSARRLRRRIGGRSNVPELEEPGSSNDEDSGSTRDLARELPYFEHSDLETDSGPDSYKEAAGRGRAEGHADAKGIMERKLLASLRGAFTQPSMDAKKLYDNRSDKKERESSVSARRQVTAKKDALQSYWFDPDADVDTAYGTGDSDTSDLESIISEAPSVASSRSSVPADIDLSAVEELRTLLLTNEALVPLYEVAISKIGPEKFYRNFRRLLLRFGRALGSEATSPVQLKAARFVRFAASRVSMQIKDGITNKDVKKQDRGRLNVKALEDHLKQIQDVDDSSDEDSEHDPEDASLQTLEGVKSFMLSSTAFSDLCRSLRLWLGMGSQAEQPNAPTLTVTEVDAKESTLVEVLSAPTDQQRPLSQEEKRIRHSPFAGAVRIALPTPARMDEVHAKGRQIMGETASSWTSVVKTARKLAWNRLSGLWQANLPPAYVRISWTCVSSRP